MGGGGPGPNPNPNHFISYDFFGFQPTKLFLVLIFFGLEPSVRGEMRRSVDSGGGGWRLRQLRRAHKKLTRMDQHGENRAWRRMGGGYGPQGGLLEWYKLLERPTFGDPLPVEVLGRCRSWARYESPEISQEKKQNGRNGPTA